MKFRKNGEVCFELMNVNLCCGFFVGVLDVKRCCMKLLNVYVCVNFDRNMISCEQRELHSLGVRKRKVSSK